MARIGRPSPPRHRAAAGLVAAVALIGAGAACGSSGRELRDPAPGATPQTRVPDPSTSTSVPLGGTAAGSVVGFTVPVGLPVMDLTSPAWTPGAVLPTDYGCGSTTPPPLAWSAPPDGTAELAIFAVDLDAGTVLWAVTGVPAVATGLDVAAMPPGAAARPNTNGNAGWDGPCIAGATHTVQFEVVALPAGAATSAGSTPGSVGARQLRDELFAQAVAYGLLSAPATAT